MQIHKMVYAIVAFIFIGQGWYPLLADNNSMSIKYDYMPRNQPLKEGEHIEVTEMIYPQSFYFGDTIYYGNFLENKTDQVIPDQIHNSIYPVQYSKNGLIFTTSRLDVDDEKLKECQCIPEQRAFTTTALTYHKTDMEPRETRIFALARIELPPLDELKTPFWQNLQESLPPEGMQCQLTSHDIDYRSIGIELLRRGSKDFDITIKPRPDYETNLLNQWYDNTPQELFPIITNDTKKMKTISFFVTQSGKNFVIIGEEEKGEFLNQIQFPGNRKPGDPNMPVNIKDWMLLEKSLEPSTMRDEIQFTRMRLEYIAAKDSHLKQKKLDELVKWLESLPRLQRLVMVYSISEGRVWTKERLEKLPIEKAKFEAAMHTLKEVPESYIREAEEMDRKQHELRELYQNEIKKKKAK